MRGLSLHFVDTENSVGLLCRNASGCGAYCRSEQKHCDEPVHGCIVTCFCEEKLRSGLLSLFKEKFALKENDIEYRYRDVAVGYVEYGTEKGELPAAY